MDTEQKRDRNRELMPNVAALVDEWREHFPGLKVIWAEDLVTGNSVGRKPEPEPNTFDIPPNYYPTEPVDTKRKERRK